MAEESILDQALAMIPGIGGKKKSPRPKPSRAKQLSTIQKTLAALSKDVAKLATMLAKPSSPKKSAASSKKPTGRRTSKPGTASASRRRGTAKGKEK